VEYAMAKKHFEVLRIRSQKVQGGQWPCLDAKTLLIDIVL
jgi:hypothetical protein